MKPHICMHDEVWGCAEILPKSALEADRKRKVNS